MFREEVRAPILGFFFMSLGGLLLHLRIHPLEKSAFNWIASGFPLVNACVLPFLFNRPTTVAWAVLFTWATVGTGTVGMAYHSVTTWKEPVTLANLVLKSTLPDILILWGKLPLALMIYRTLRPGRTPEAERAAP